MNKKLKPTLYHQRLCSALAMEGKKPTQEAANAYYLIIDAVDSDLSRKGRGGVHRDDDTWRDIFKLSNTLIQPLIEKYYPNG